VRVARAAGILVVVTAACHGSGAPRPSPDAAATPSDSVRGIVQRIGSELRTALTVRGADGATCVLRFAGAARPPALEGLEAVLWGIRSTAAAPPMPGTPCTVDVAAFAVRAVDGIAAVDGVLRTDGASFALETAPGTRRPLREVPAALRTQVGARIFWAGPLDRAPAAYGVLVPATP